MPEDRPAERPGSDALTREILASLRAGAHMDHVQSLVRDRSRVLQQLCGTVNAPALPTAYSPDTRAILRRAVEDNRQLIDVIRSRMEETRRKIAQLVQRHSSTRKVASGYGAGAHSCSRLSLRG